MRNFSHRRFNRPPLPEGKRREFTHSVTNIKDGNTQIEIAENGRVKIMQEHKDDTYDEVELSAAQIFTIANTLRITGKVRIVDKDK